MNHDLVVPERIVLPRLSDVISTASAMLARRFGLVSVEMLALDFRDAFKQLWAHPSEQRFMAGSYSEGFFTYLRVLFGVATGPLVWGRVAACLMRATHALYPPPRLGLACFVDDPFLLSLARLPTERSDFLWLLCCGALWAFGSLSAQG